MNNDKPVGCGISGTVSVVHESRRFVMSCSGKLKPSPAIHHAIPPGTGAALAVSPSFKTSSKVVSTSSQVASAENNENNSELRNLF